jgi:putative copper resistance protein D
MLEPAVIILRLVQFTGAMILLGSSLFFVYALPKRGPGSGAELAWSRPLLGWAAAVLALASLVGMLAQTSILAGSIAEGVKPSSLLAVITTMSMGPATLVRAGCAAVALALVVGMAAGRPLFLACAALGAAASGTFAWMGHGAATPGPPGLLHLLADILHSIAAGVWIGALVVFLGLLGGRSREVSFDRVVHKALHGFAGVGSLIVAVLVATGLVNSGFLVGPSRLSGLWTTPYGRLLLFKLVLFGGMLAMAAANRFRHTPALALVLGENDDRMEALATLRRSVVFETGLALAVLAVVTTMSMGPATLMRAGAAAVAFVLLTVMRPARPLFLACAALGGLASATFAWMGHGAATPGPPGLLHLVADILHSVAAGVWFGALIVFLGLLRGQDRDLTLDRILHKALHGFAGVGSLIVAVLVATGLVNSGFLVGLSRLAGMWTTPYGQLLSLKLVLFVGMLAMAAVNRFRHTPALALVLGDNDDPTRALTSLRRSVVLETALALGVLALVAWLGTLAPVSAQ